MIKVLLAGKEIAILDMQGGKPRFSFTHLTTVSPSPLELPLGTIGYQSPHAEFNFLPGIIYDSLPDDFGRSALSKYLGENITEFDRLLFLGKRAMGALEYEPSSEHHAKQDILDIAQYVELARQVVEGRVDAQKMQEIIQAAATPGGARPKAIVDWHQNENKIRSGLDGGYKDGFLSCVMKFDGFNLQGSHQDYTVVEHVYHLMAKEAGIHTANTHLLEAGGLVHFMSERFDRTIHGHKIHMASMSGLLSVSHKHPGAAGYGDLLRLTLMLTEDVRQVREAMMRMLFNLMARNQDDHTKNFSFLQDLSTGQWRLSPAYDLTYANGADWTAKHQLHINGKREASSITYTDLLNVVERSGLSKKDLDYGINAIRESLSQWNAKAQTFGVSKERIERISQSLLLQFTH